MIAASRVWPRLCFCVCSEILVINFADHAPRLPVWLPARLLIGLACALLLCLAGGPARGAEIPAWLPKYDLDINLECDKHIAHIRERVTWTNTQAAPVSELVFNVHSHYHVPDDQIGFLAKMLEIMRMKPSEALMLDGPACQVEQTYILEPEVPGTGEAKPAGPAAPPAGPPGDKVQTLPRPRPVPLVPKAIPFHYEIPQGTPDVKKPAKDGDEPLATALVLPLPRPIAQGESVTVEIDFTMHLPQKQGRWGQWEGVTFLSNWLPVVAVYNEKGWQPTPFIPWHQPFFNEAGRITARVTLPSDQKIACTGSIVGTQDLGNGLQQVDIFCPAARDFALLTSARYKEFSTQVGPVKLKVMAFPEHEHYAQAILKIIAEAIPVYSQWFGAYPYPEFTIAESYFGWNGNECSGLVMIDSRVFGMPDLAEGYVEYLVSHEVCHQWWYNTVGTNGYCETFMDEALANYFSHRLINQKRGKNNCLLRYPAGLEWLPNINRENYRYYGLYGTIGRGEAGPVVQEMPKFGHVVNLFSMCYDKGAKVIGTIEDRLGEEAFLDFMHIIYRKYYFKILRVADFQHELEAYTGRSWEKFFQDWLYGPGLSDWSVEKVEIESKTKHGPFIRLPWHRPDCSQGCKVTVLLHQKAEICEQTSLGICLEGGSGGFPIRIPIMPDVKHLDIENPPAQVDTLPDNRVRVVVELPCRPEQIAVDPDQILCDKDPANNYWKPQVHWRLTPLYTALEETDLTCDYDKWNVIAGPWIYNPSYDDPWFTRSTMLGGRVGLYRTQHFDGGIYAAYRTDFRDVVVGADAIWDHCPIPHMQLGMVAEQRLATFFSGDQNPSRAAVFARYVIDYGDSLYLPPFQYVEAFANIQQNFLPNPRQEVPGAQRYDYVTFGGLHYHINYLTPYWDPEGGFQLDATYAGGMAALARNDGFHQLTGQVSFVKGLPDGLGWFSNTRLAMRAYGAGALPQAGEFFPLGGSTRFRGFDMAQRQGNAVAVGSLEWRLPVCERVNWDCCDHVVGVRNIYVAPFYDVGDSFVAGHQIDNVVHALGCGLRVDVAWFSFIERSVLRFDVAKTINASTPTQFWFGFEHPF